MVIGQGLKCDASLCKAGVRSVLILITYNLYLAYLDAGC